MWSCKFGLKSLDTNTDWNVHSVHLQGGEGSFSQDFMWWHPKCLIYWPLWDEVYSVTWQTTHRYCSLDLGLMTNNLTEGHEQALSLKLTGKLLWLHLSPILLFYQKGSCRLPSDDIHPSVKFHVKVDLQSFSFLEPQLSVSTLVTTQNWTWEEDFIKNIFWSITTFLRLTEHWKTSRT
jgi:hypothetical protein